MGDGARKERSVIDPELECLRKPCACWLPLPCDEVEPRRTMRFVTVSPTGVGVVAWVRRAAAAAADERAPVDSRSRIKALVAAREAEALAGWFWLLALCIGDVISMCCFAQEGVTGGMTYRIRGCAPPAAAEHCGQRVLLPGRLLHRWARQGVVVVAATCGVFRKL